MVILLKIMVIYIEQYIKDKEALERMSIVIGLALMGCDGSEKNIGVTNRALSQYHLTCRRRSNPRKYSDVIRWKCLR